MTPTQLTAIAEDLLRRGAAAQMQVLGAAAVLGVALLQLVLARWRDLGPITVAAAGALFLLAPGPLSASAAAAASAIAAVGWARGSRRGVGHPALVGTTFAFAVAAAVTAELAGGVQPGLRPVGAVAVGVVGAVLGAVALRRPGGLHPAVRWLGEIRIAPPRAEAEPRVPRPEPPAG